MIVKAIYKPKSEKSALGALPVIQVGSSGYYGTQLGRPGIINVLIIITGAQADLSLVN